MRWLTTFSITVQYYAISTCHVKRFRTFCPLDVATTQWQLPWTKDEFINVFLYSLMRSYHNGSHYFVNRNCATLVPLSIFWQIWYLSFKQKDNHISNSKLLATDNRFITTELTWKRFCASGSTNGFSNSAIGQLLIHRYLLKTSSVVIHKTTT